MSHSRLVRACGAALAVGALLLGTLMTVPTMAIDIPLHYSSGDNPAWDPTGSVLWTTFEAAASYWEALFPLSPRTFSVDIEWANDLGSGTLGLWTWDPFGNNNIQISSDPAVSWWADPTPYDSSEFGFVQTLYKQLTPTQQSGWISGPAPSVLEVGYQGYAPFGSAPYGNYDLLSVCIHELGHELGIRDIDGDAFPFFPHEIGGISDVGARKRTGTGTHLADDDALMNPFTSRSRRQLPSATDILAVAAQAGFTQDIAMRRTEFLNVNSNFNDPLNWVGHASSPLHDAAVHYNGGVAANASASADMTFDNLSIYDNCWVSPNGHTFRVNVDLTVDAAGAGGAKARLLLSPAGTVIADRIRLLHAGQFVMQDGLVQTDTLEADGMFGSQFVMYDGTLRVNQITGATGIASFGGNLEIGIPGPHGGSETALTPGAQWTVGKNFYVGSDVFATVKLQSGAAVSASFVGIGKSSAAWGSVIVDGQNSRLTSSGDLWVAAGAGAMGDLTIRNQGTVQTAWAGIGYSAGAPQGRVWVDGADSYFHSTGDTLVGNGVGGYGTLTVQNGASAQVDGIVVALPYGVVNVQSGQMSAGSFNVEAGGQVAVGTPNTTGTLTVNNTLRIKSGGTVSVANPGYLYANAIDLTGGGNLATAGPNSTIYTNGIVGMPNSFTINGNLGVGWSGGSHVGNVTIGSGQTLEVTSVLSLGDDSAGTLTVTSGGTATIQQARIGDHGTGWLTVTGTSAVVNQYQQFLVGYYGADAIGFLQIDQGGAIFGNSQAAYVGSGSGAAGSALVTGASSKWTGLGSLDIGSNAAGAGSGAVGIDDSALVSATNVNVWDTGNLVLDGGTLRVASLTVTGGLLRGRGTISPPPRLTTVLQNAGVVEPGFGGGELDVVGSFTQSPTGQLLIELAGSTAFDRLHVTSLATLDGELAVTLLNGYSPHVGDSFDLLDWGSRSGHFAMLVLPALTAGLAWDTSQLYTAGLLSVVEQGLSGDYNHDGVVDAADYVVWRQGLGTTYTPGDYNLWRAHFGQSAGSGVSLASQDTAIEIPESCTVPLTIVGGTIAIVSRICREQITKMRSRVSSRNPLRK